MLFVSKIFLFYFLPLFLLFFYLSKKRARFAVLALFSSVFYGWWDWRFLFLLGYTVCFDYICGQIIYNTKSDRVRKLCLVSSITTNLLVLGFFKYFLFINNNLAALLGTFGVHYPEALLTLKIVLPVGVSFYTFQSMSYIIDLYRREIKPAENIFIFYAFVSMFPQLVAGPIVRYAVLEHQINNPVFTPARIYRGLQFFILGLSKKVLLADPIAVLAERVFDAPSLGVFSGTDGVIGIVSYTLQIYFDFSGYSDMAVGLGYFIGYQFPQNFDSPYKSKSITEFWRRWHMTLSFWLRDYLYIPLGGNRKGKFRTELNLMITMFLGGLWHGASWNFVIWGVLHGAYLVADRKLGKKNPINKLGAVGQHVWTMILVMFAWIFFRAKDLPTSLSFIKLFSNWETWNLHETLVHEKQSLATLTLGLVIVFTMKNTFEISDRPTWLRTTLLVLLYVLSIAFLFGNVSHPFLYFQF